MKTKLRVRILGLFLLGACSIQCGVTEGELGSETNWSKGCDESSECGENACICGACTRSCDADADCAGLARGVCATLGSESQLYQCGEAAESKPGICLPRCETARDCAAGRRCIAGSCVMESDSSLDPGDGGAGDGGSSSDDVEVVIVGVLSNDLVPKECIEDLPELIPGCSVDDSSTWGLDCDGDSVPDYRAYDCVTENAERPGDFHGDYDCVVDDQKLRYWVTPDADGDGVGQGTPMCAGPVVPEGFIRLTSAAADLQDCDDMDPAVYPGATDTWGDGMNSDCYNEDYPICSVIEAGSEFPVELPPATGCEGVDLYFSGPAVCADRCRNHGALYGFVVNAGTEASAESITLSWRDQDGNADSTELSGSLGTGEATPLFEVPFDLVTEMTLTIDAEGDCDSSNNEYVFSNPSGDQTCLF